MDGDISSTGTIREICVHAEDKDGNKLDQVWLEVQWKTGGEANL